MRAFNRFNLNPERPVVFLMGGSQGSAMLNRTMQTILEQPDLKDVQVLWQTGSGQYNYYSGFDSDTVRVVAFIEHMADAYAIADLVISRAGALTLAEITACGKPSILVPLPGAAGDHQTKNAQSLVANSAAKMIPEKDLTPEGLKNLVLGLLENKSELERLAQNAKSLGKPDAVEIIVNHILEIAEA
ncbi:MAG: hypothetical protein GXO92_05625 [FCB group bacterium]|nr:hypothetical protein [FCB group bacterium]